MAKQSEVSEIAIMDDDAVLRDIHSLSDALDALSQAGIAVKDATDYGSGFRVIPDKNQLVKSPFVILGGRQHNGDMGLFTILYVVTESGDKWVVTDGSTGIHKQISSLIESGVQIAGLFFKDGLTRSDYEYVDESGASRPATTYYLSGI